MTWVVSAVTSILYPALTKFEERVRTRVYTISEESGLSSDNSSSCSTCNEDLYETCGSLPSGSTRKVSFTDTSIKPTTMSIPSEFRSISGKPTSLLSSKSSFTSFTKSTHMSLDSDALKGKIKRGKTAVYLSPSKYSGLFSTTSSMRSSKSDSHISQLQKDAAGASEKPPIPHHGKCKRRSKGLLPKTEANTTDTEGVPFGGGEHKLPHGPQEPCEPISLRDLKCVFADLKSHLTQITAIILDDIFKRILGDLGFPTCSVSISMEVLLESISESLLGSHPGGPPDSGSVSRIASFVANDIVESVLCKLHSATQKKYSETVSREDFSAGCKGVVASGKHGVPDPAFWRTRMPLSLETVYGIAEEIVHIVIDKLKVFATSSQTKLSQFELCAKIKAIGIPLEQLYAAIPPHTVESEAATAIVKDTIRKIVSKTIASSETNILQYAEEIISSIMNFIQRRASQEGILPRRESSIILQLVNDVFNDLSLEKLWGASAPAKSRASPEAPGELSSHETSKSRPTTAADEKRMRKPYPLVPVPGMVIYSESEVEGKEKTEPDGTFSTVNKERRVLVTERSQEKVSYGLESRQRSRPSSKSSHEEGEKGREAKTKGLERTKGSVENFVQEAILCSIEGQQTVQYPADQVSGSAQAAADGGLTLEQALKKMEEDFKEGEQS
ncbi:fibrous sheath-interacting protein 2-like [Hemicordylus capensis]|uniref:fibrous sheath-interacting protein 2-like n=1 Tax=Hemicordylus capensis TaxID=884348 RepID=UPI002302A43D|nr:fibrous sheath-interacting protein 2-like [Hemicordylus capensis]